jgi:hypothetical protein
MKRLVLIIVIAALLAIFTAGCSSSGSSVSQEPAITATSEATPAPAATESPALSPSDTPVATDDITGVSSESGYVNDALGFSVSYPEGYTVLTPDQIDTLMAQAIDQIKSAFSDPDLAQRAISQSIPKAMAFKHPLTYTDSFNSNFNLIISGLPAGTSSDIMTIATDAIEQAGSQAPSMQYGEPSSAQIGGKDAVMVTLKQSVNGYDLDERQYYFLRDNYLVIITIGADNEDDLSELNDMVQSIQFTQ